MTDAGGAGGLLDLDLMMGGGGSTTISQAPVANVMGDMMDLFGGGVPAQSS